MNNKLVLIDACVIIDAFDSSSSNHNEAHKLIERTRNERYEIIMPMHGFFEIKCALQRISQVEGKTVTSPYDSELKGLNIRPQPIDHKFIENYYDVDIPYAKAGDTIYMVMAKKLGMPLITRDNGMYKVAKKAGINVFTISEALNT